MRFGLVDVPGHERFIKAMVAGAGGLDLVCLVIAADEGIMPQTREHLDICELLGVRLGTIVLSKADLVDEEWLELVAGEIKEELAGSFLEDAEIIPVSVKTGQGLDDLRNTLMKLTDGLQTRTPDGRFRLPVDRIFSVKGFGTVVTGTVISGNAAVGDELICAPGPRGGEIEDYHSWRRGDAETVFIEWDRNLIWFGTHAGNYCLSCPVLGDPVLKPRKIERWTVPHGNRGWDA